VFVVVSVAAFEEQNTFLNLGSDHFSLFFSSPLGPTRVLIHILLNYVDHNKCGVQNQIVFTPTEAGKVRERKREDREKGRGEGDEMGKMMLVKKKSEGL
jgi:hypothetical protein